MDSVMKGLMGQCPHNFGLEPLLGPATPPGVVVAACDCGAKYKYSELRRVKPTWALKNQDRKMKDLEKVKVC